MKKFSIKSPQEIEIMTQGGAMLAKIKRQLAEAADIGMTTLELDSLAEKLIEKTGGEAAFKRVPGYKHATCININEEVVHGIPGERRIKNGDLVAIDVGLYYKGFYTDTSVSVGVGKISPKVKLFLEVGKKALSKAIFEARPGKRVIDISTAMQKTIEKAGYSVVRSLTGHGVGRELHEEPAIPCFRLGEYQHSPKLVSGMVIAVEVMYNEGGWEVVYKNDDGWTIGTADGKISGLFEETVAITASGPVVLTD